MWYKLDKPKFENISGRDLIIINLSQNKFNETEIYGDNKKPLTIQDEINRVKNLYKENFKNFNCREPEKDELIVINATQPYRGIHIIREDASENHYYDIDAYVDIHEGLKDRIILPYPLISRCPQQAIHHEVGHWFFDRLGDKLAIDYKYTHRNGIIIDEEQMFEGGRVVNKEIASFDDSTEMAAYFCEEYFNKKYDRLTHQYRNLLRELDGICNKYDKPLKGIYCVLENHIKKSNGK